MSILNRLRRSSFNPMVNNNKVMPKSANVFNPGIVSIPMDFITKPDIKKPTSGGNPVSFAINPKPKINAIIAVEE